MLKHGPKTASRKRDVNVPGRFPRRVPKRPAHKHCGQSAASPTPIICHNTFGPFRTRVARLGTSRVPQAQETPGRRRPAVRRHSRNVRKQCRLSPSCPTPLPVALCTPFPGCGGWHRFLNRCGKTTRARSGILRNSEVRISNGSNRPSRDHCQRYQRTETLAGSGPWLSHLRRDR